jgi:hypothetical protein
MWLSRELRGRAVPVAGDAAAWQIRAIILLHSRSISVSDNILKIVPRDPLFRPSEDAEAAVIRLLREMIPYRDSLEVKRHDAIVFVDCGENHERTTCPVCDADLSQHWSRWMTDSFDRSLFRDREVVVPCCGAKVDLNDLQYYFPVCFASWFVELWNPDPATFMPTQSESLIEAALGNPVRQILARI